MGSAVILGKLRQVNGLYHPPVMYSLIQDGAIEKGRAQGGPFRKIRS